ncbi:hypothetical protein QOT17_025091 [Balamuthia mandrillaris]
MNYLKQRVNTLNGMTVTTENAITKETLSNTLGRTRVEFAGLFVHTELDEVFENGRQNFEKLVKTVETAEKYLKSYAKAFHDVVKPMTSLSLTLQAFYDGPSTLNQQGNLFMASSEAVADAIKEFTSTMQELTTEVRTLLSTMSLIKKTILERDEALIEFTKADNNLKNVLKKDADSSSPKATKAQTRQQESKDRYEALNNELKAKFKDYDLHRAAHFEAQFSKLVKSQAKLFSLSARATQALQAQIQSRPSTSCSSRSSSASASSSSRILFATLHSRWNPASVPYSTFDGEEGATRKARRKSWDSPRASARVSNYLEEEFYTLMPSLSTKTAGTDLTSSAASTSTSTASSSPPSVSKREPPPRPPRRV